MLFVYASHTYTTLSNLVAIPIGCLKQDVVTGQSKEPSSLPANTSASPVDRNFQTEQLF